ncbi:MAG: AAA family ATPase [Planctomycetaceae bacterium]|nr:AAA family ATPase [Planctomycetaceae bacterium]
MHEVHWRLTRPAFECDADGAFYFPSRSHDGALLKLRYVVEHRKGVGALIGGHGMGKSYLIQRLIHELGHEQYHVARIVFPALGSRDLLRDIAVRVGADISPTAGEGIDVLLRAIEQRLRQLTASGRQPLLIIDEAQVLEVEQLQTLQLLLNLDDGVAARLSLILAGHVELLPRVKRVGGLDSRLAARCALSPLSAEETAEYVRHRLEVAGRQDCPFHDAALATIFELSQGVPRRINQVCDLALLIGFADERRELTPVDVEAAAAELAQC